LIKAMDLNSNYQKKSNIYSALILETGFH